MEGAPADQAFHMNAEIEIQNLKELNDVLQQVHEKSFRSHVSEKKNDFASWVRHSVKDEELALRLEKTLDFEQTKRIIADRILELDPPKKEEPIEDSKATGLDEQHDSLNLNFDDIDLPPVPPGSDPYKETPMKEEPKVGTEKTAPTTPNIEPLTLPKLPSVPEIGQIKTELHPFQKAKHTFMSVMIGFISGIFAGFVLGIAYMLWMG
jgi:hypothetical protein